MSVAVVVITYNRAHLLRRCVENVLQRASPATTEILVWDNGSTDGTADYLDALDDARIRAVHHPRNLGQNAYAEAFALVGGDHLVELDDDVIEAPHAWDATLLEAFERLPEIGFLAADLVDNPHDQAAVVRYRVRPHLYVPFELHGVRLLDGPAGGGCAMTSRELYDRVGGFRRHARLVFWSEEAAYIEDIERLGYRKAVLADLKVLHAGGPYYSEQPPEKLEFWSRRARLQARKDAVKRVLLFLPLVRRLNARYRWFAEPGTA
jgi:GT2 family glycosyltransferase